MYARMYSGISPYFFKPSSKILKATDLSCVGEKVWMREEEFEGLWAALSCAAHLAAVVLHQCCRHKDVVARAGVLPGLLEDGAARFDSLRSPSKLHVLNVDQSGVNVLNDQQLIVDAVDLLVLHATL